MRAALEGEMEGTPEDNAQKEKEVTLCGPAQITKQAIAFLEDDNPPREGGLISSIQCGDIWTPLETFTEAFSRRRASSGSLVVPSSSPVGYARR